MMKKIVNLEGRLVFPLQVGRRALIRLNGDFIRTSLVVEILVDRRDYACFETMNSVYKVNLTPMPAEAISSLSLMRAS
jgi:hypothetical protein